MRRSINKIGWKVFIYHNMVIFLFFMCLHLLIPLRFEAYITKEKESSLKHLNEVNSRYGRSYLNFSSYPSFNFVTSFNEVVLPYYQINPDFRYMALIHENDKPSLLPCLYNIEIGEAKKFIDDKTNETVVSYKKPGMLSVVTPIFGKLSSTETEETKYGYLIAGFSLEDQKNELKRVRYVILFIWGLFIVLGNLLAYYQYRLITTPLKKSSALIKDVVQGDLRGMIQSRSRDELGSLCHSLNDMVKVWREKLSEIKTIIESSCTVSTEISIAVSQQEKTTLNQAYSISQVATTIEELNATSKIVHEKAEGVERKSIELLQVSLDGQTSVNMSIETFSGIRENVENIAEYVLNLSEETQQIGIILKEASAIVTQTDMLAVNAGIRAARVKENGKQFTIIATELTDLANQSQVSAGKVSSLIAEIQNSNQSTVIAMDQAIERVEGGIKLILKAGKTIETSIRNVNETVDSVKGIALSARQQFLCTNQVNQSIVSINEGMQETALSSKQTLGETENLHKVNQELLQMIRFYKV